MIIYMAGKGAHKGRAHRPVPLPYEVKSRKNKRKLKKNKGPPKNNGPNPRSFHFFGRGYLGAHHGP